MRSIQGNLGPRPWCIDLAIARSIHRGRGRRFPLNDRTEEVNKLFIISRFFIKDLSLRSLKTNNCSANNFKKHATSMSCTLEDAIQSSDTGQRIPFSTAVSHDHNMDVHRIILETDWICLGHLASNAGSLQENSQSERAYYCSHIHMYLTIIPRARMGSKSASWAIVSEAMRARGISVLVKSN